MEKTKVIKGGSFLVEDIRAEAIFTPEDFTEEQNLFGKTTEDFVNEEVVPVLGELETHDFQHSRKLLTKAGELGLLGVDVPEKFGGLGLDKISSSIITEKFSRAGGFSLSYGAHVGIGSLPIVFFGNETQKRTYLPDLATGAKIAAYALTEPGSGSDALGAKTTAVLNEAGTHYILNGQKQWITNAGFADIFIVYAKVDGEHFSAFIVERDFPGVSTGSEEKKMGIKSSSTRSLILEDVNVPKENVLGEIGKGHIIAFNILNIGRYKLGVGCIGGAKRALQLATTYAKERKQFKQPIANFPLIQEKLASMATAIYAAESSIYRTGGLMEERLRNLSDEKQNDGQMIAKAIADYAIECSLNKIVGSETLDFVIDEAVQIHGGYGFMAEYEIERMYRDSRINRIFEGTNEINRLLVPTTIMRKSLRGELPFLEKAAALQKELVLYVPEEVEQTKLSQEKYLLKMAKKIFFLSAGTAVQKFEQQLAQEQEILANIATIVSEIYDIESVILRTEKALLKDGLSQNEQKLLMTEVYCQEAFNRIEAAARETLAATEEGDNLQIALSFLRKLTRHKPINIIGKKRQIANTVLAKEGYVV